MDYDEGKDMLRWLFVLVAVFVMAKSLYAAGYLDTPDVCMTLQKAEPTEVHLQPVGVCKGSPGRAFVDNNPGDVIKVFINGDFIGEQQVKKLSVADVSGALAKGAEMAKGLELQRNPHDDAMVQRAESLNAYYNSDEFRARVEEQMDRIKDGSLGVKTSDYYTDMPADRKGHLGENERIYVFVSKSMPLHVIRTYAADIARLGDRRVQMVMRGFVGGMSKIVPTINFVADVLKKDPMCQLTSESKCEMLGVDFLIDPLLFQRYGVERVPTFVYASGVEVKNPGGSEGFTPNIMSSGNVLSIAGDASFAYILSNFARESGSDMLAQAASTLR